MYEYKLEETHNFQLKMLEYFDSFCSENDLRYCLWAGTLLGAIRHKGFIPWDDDVDVAMPRKDYDRLVMLLKNRIDADPNSTCELCDYKHSGIYFYPFAKLFIKNTLLVEESSRYQGYGCYIDIFPIDDADHFYRFRSAVSRLLFYLQYIRLKPTGKVHGIEYLFKVLSCCVPLKAYPLLIDFFAKKKGNGRSIAVFVHRQLANKKYSFDDIFPTKRATFCNLNLPVPNNSIGVLQKMYGDWRELPPLDKREGKHSSHCYNITKTNILIVLDGCIGHGGQFMLMRTIVNRNISEYSFDFLQTISDKSVVSKEFVDELRAKGCNVYSIKNMGIKKNVQQFRSLLLNKRYDIIHFNMGRSALAYAFACSRAKNNAKVIFHSHTNGNGSSLLNRLALSLLVKPKLKRTGDCFVACSEDAGESMFGRLFFKRNGVVMNNAIDLSAFFFSQKTRDLYRKKLCVGNETVVIGHVGRFSPEKNQELIVQAVDQIINEGFKNIKVIFIGDGAYQPRIKALVTENCLEPYFDFLGAVDNVPCYLNAMDIFLFPSKYEGFGLAALEAQANGLKCVCAPNISEKINVTPNVVFAKTYNPTEWAYIFLDLLRKNKLGRAFYYDLIDRSGFSVESMGDMIRRLYNKR